MSHRNFYKKLNQFPVIIKISQSKYVLHHCYTFEGFFTQNNSNVYFIHITSLDMFNIPICFWQLGEPLCKNIYKIPSHGTIPYKGQKEGK